MHDRISSALVALKSASGKMREVGQFGTTKPYSYEEKFMRSKYCVKSLKDEQAEVNN